MSATKENIEINVGGVTSFNSLVNNLGPRFKLIREFYLTGQTPQIYFDLTSLQYGTVSIAALTALLSVSKKLRDYIGYPIPARIKWNPRLQGFLSDIGFFTIVDRFKIFSWTPPENIGGYDMGKTNPYTKILFYADIPNLVEDLKNRTLRQIKDDLKVKISPHLKFLCNKIFYDIEMHKSRIVTENTIELITNSLTHGQDIAFVSIQRSFKRITVSVCDSGIGFPNSLVKSFPGELPQERLSHLEGLVIGSIIQKNDHGLRLGITDVVNYNEIFSDVLKNEGWVIMSSFDSEIRWQKHNWKNLLEFSAINDFKKLIPNIPTLVGQKLVDYIEDKDKFYEGYWRKYDQYLTGTRITFEIPLQND